MKHDNLMEISITKKTQRPPKVFRFPVVDFVQQARDMLRFLVRILVMGMGIFSSLLVVLGLFEGILRLRYKTIPITHEFMLTAQETARSTDYIFEPTYVPEVQHNDRYHIAIIGDSFSACRMFDSVTCYPELIERMLLQQNKKVDIYNYALPGNNTDREFSFFVDKILPTHPDLVLWQFYSNDVWENTLFPIYTIGEGRRLTRVSGAENWAYKRQIFFDALPMNRLLLRSYVVRSALRLFEYESDDTLPYDNEEQRILWSLEKMKLEIEEMNRLSRMFGFRVLYFQIPTQSVYLKEAAEPQFQWMRDYNIRVFRAIEAMLASQEGYVSFQFAPEVSLQDRVLGAFAEPVHDRFYMREMDMNIIGDKHLSQEGNQVVADELMNQIHLFLE